MNHTSERRLIATWTCFRAVWALYIISSDILYLLQNGDLGGYGIAPNKFLLLMIGAMPPQLVCNFVLMDQGRRADIGVEILVAGAYLLVAVGLFRDSKFGRVSAIALYCLEVILLAVYIGYVIPLLWRTWDASLRTFSVFSGCLFLGIASLCLVSQIRARPVKQPSALNEC
jgi:hypothetical protein